MAILFSVRSALLIADKNPARRFRRGPNSGRWQFNHEFLEELSTMYAAVNGRYAYSTQIDSQRKVLL